MARVLVAGIGNVFQGDDGFGVEVVRRLRAAGCAEGVEAVDFGIRGIHLAYTLADGQYDLAILVDATARGGAPGTLYAIVPDPDDGESAEAADAHTLTPAAVLAWLRRLDAPRAPMVIVGCEPATLDESMGLSAPVAASVDEAVQMVRELVAKTTGGEACA